MSGEERHAEETRRVAADGTPYHCEAYGPNSRGYCFMEMVSPCTSRVLCERRLMQERMLVWVRLLALRAAGDDTAAFILRTTDSPWQLLNGDLWAREAGGPGSGE